MRSLSAHSDIALSRLRGERLKDGITSGEVLVLICAGVVATSLVAFLHMPIRVPGHSILKAALPIVCATAMVPRPLAGSLTALSAALTAGAFLLMGIGHLQAAAITSLLAVGPAVDLALRNSRGGGLRLYNRLALAGFAANMLAFMVRWGISLTQVNTLHPLHFRQVAFGAFLSFAACGLAAGLICGVICFRPSRHHPDGLEP